MSIAGYAEPNGPEMISIWGGDGGRSKSGCSMEILSANDDQSPIVEKGSLGSAAVVGVACVEGVGGGVAGVFFLPKQSNGSASFSTLKFSSLTKPFGYNKKRQLKLLLPISIQQTLAGRIFCSAGLPA